MNKIFSLLIVTFLALAATAQKNEASVKKTFLTFNPFSLFEPHAAAGFGISKNIKARSSYFGELSYVFKTPFYRGAEPVTGGFRLLQQYRYGVNMQYKAEYFIGAELRLKHFGFTGNNNVFINTSANDTISRYNYKAKATSVGGAIVIGTIINVSKNKKWQIEFTTGIGVKHKFVEYKNLPLGYKLFEPGTERRGTVGPPEIDEAVGMPYIPSTLRLRYLIN